MFFSEELFADFSPSASREVLTALDILAKDHEKEYCRRHLIRLNQAQCPSIIAKTSFCASTLLTSIQDMRFPSQPYTSTPKITCILMLILLILPSSSSSPTSSFSIPPFSPPLTLLLLTSSLLPLLRQDLLL